MIAPVLAAEQIGSVAPMVNGVGKTNWNHGQSDLTTDIETINSGEPLGVRPPHLQEPCSSFLDEPSQSLFKHRPSWLEKDVMDKLSGLHDTLEHVSERVDLMYDEMKKAEQGKRNRSFNNHRARTIGMDMFGNSNYPPPAPVSPSHQLSHGMFDGRGGRESGVGRSFFRQPSSLSEEKRGILPMSPETGFHELRSVDSCASHLLISSQSDQVHATESAGTHGTPVAIPEEGLLPTLPIIKRDGSTDLAPAVTNGSRRGGSTGRRTAFVSATPFQDCSRVSLNGAHLYNLIKLGVRRYQFLEDIWVFLDDRESGTAALYFTKAICYLIIFSVFLPFLQTINRPPLPDVVAAVLETAIDSIFSLMILLRLVSCPSKTKFFQSPTNWFDLCALPSFAIRASLGFVLVESKRDTAEGLILLCLVPVLRLLKMIRHFETFQILLGAFELALEALPVLLYMLGVIMFASASCIYAVEPRDNIESFPKAIWLSIVTITTVGYGDVTPSTNAGHVVVAALVLSSVLFMAMPLGIIGSAFNTTWNDRDRILLMQRTRRRLVQWGYTANDILVLFKLVDLDGDGQLNFEEFNRLLKRLKIELSDDRVVQLFSMFDCDASGYVDPQEFVRLLYPSSFTDCLVSDLDKRGKSPFEERGSTRFRPINT